MCSSDHSTPRQPFVAIDFGFTDLLVIVSGSSDSIGGIWLPKSFTVPRSGIVGRVCRFFGFSYGWVTMDTASIIRKRVNDISIKGILHHGKE